MKDTELIIQLTLPIEGVQYGRKPAEEKGHYTFEFSGNAICKYDDYNPLRDCWQILFSTNPKDTRFPYLQLPSKEQEVKQQFVKAVISGLTGSNISPEYRQDTINKVVDVFNANPAIFTQEQIEKAFKAGANLYSRIKHDMDIKGFEFKDFIQSLQPTAKAVRVEMEKLSVKYCNTSKEGYEIKVETSPEYPQGLVRALEVII